jgi:hypothetical protein
MEFGSKVTPTCDLATEADLQALNLGDVRQCEAGCSLLAFQLSAVHAYPDHMSQTL